MVEMLDFQSLYVSLMFLCFLQKQKAGVRIGTYFLALFFFNSCPTDLISGVQEP